MMFTHFFKIYNSYKGASSHSKQEEQLQNGATARNYLTIHAQNPHNEQISKQRACALAFSASWEQADRAEEAETPQCGKSERAECGADTKTFLSNVYKMSTRAKRFRHFFKIYETCGRRMMSSRRKFLTINTNNVHEEKISKQGLIIRPQYGRSMVEMLGVLAIIGVLSVGGIAGYSKAMMKYKMNKFTVAMNELLNTSIQYKGQLGSPNDTSHMQYFAEIIHKMNAIPDGIKYYNSQYLKDMFGNLIMLYRFPANKQSGLEYRLNNNGTNHISNEFCYQLLKIAKENSSLLYRIYISNRVTAFNDMFGDDYCSDNSRCLNKMTITDMNNFCNSCVKNQICYFDFRWY